MAEKIQIAIIGLGLLGTSAGLALRRHQDKVSVVGHDKNSDLAGNARKIGAVDRTEWNLINAVAGADRVLLALPADEIRDTLSAIGDHLKVGCLLLDMAEVKSQVLAWAAEMLPKTAHLVGGHPIIVVENPRPEDAIADLFQGKLFCLTPHAATDETAVRLAVDLVEALGAKPFFLDPSEHDSMVAATEHAPQVMAAALLASASRSPDWRDLRKVAGSQFYSSSLIMAPDGRAWAASLVANREHVLAWLDALIAALETWRQRLAGGDEAFIAEELDRLLTARGEWVIAMATGRWEEEAPRPEMPTAGGMMRSLIGFGSRPIPPEKGKR